MAGKRKAAKPKMAEERKKEEELSEPEKRRGADTATVEEPKKKKDEQRDLQDVDDDFTNYYTVFNVLMQIGYLCHNRQYWRWHIAMNVSLLSGYVLCGKPRYRDYFFLGFLLFTIFTVAEGLPAGANHKMVLGFVSCLLLPQQIQRCMHDGGSDKTTSAITAATAHALNVVRWAVIIMYFFAGFHKINHDFLFEPTVSCAFDKIWYYLELMGYEDYSKLPRWMLYTPHSVLIVEMIPPVLWFINDAKLQKIAVANMILLHLILLPMGFADFGSIAQSFLILFVPPKVFATSGLPLRYFFYMAMIFVFFESLTMLHWFLTDDDDVPFFETEVGLVLFGYGIMWCFLFQSAQWMGRGVKVYCPKSFVSRCAIAFFIFFAMNPYLGLRTAGNLTMFSNLRTEGPTSNHLLFRNNPLKVFGFQEDVAEILEAHDVFRERFEEGDIMPRIMLERELQILAFAHKKGLMKIPNISLKLNYGGTIYETEDLLNDPEFDVFRQKRPFWQEKFILMRHIQKEGPQECTW